MDRRQGVPRPQRVLIVDDSADIRELWRLWLTHFDFHVVEASNGAEAVSKALQLHPDVVLLDLRMPVMDGLEALQRLRVEERTAGVPVIMVSAQADQVERARALGSDAFVAKPATQEALLEQVRAVLGRRRSS